MVDHRPQDDDGALVVGGVDVRDLAREHGTPAYVLDEEDFRGRARAFRDAFAGYDVYYAGKAFLCTYGRAGIAEEGLCLDVCSGGELTVASGPGSTPAGSASTATTSRWPSCAARSRPGSAGSSSTPSTRSTGSRAVAASPGARASVLVRVTAGVEAHTHEYIATAHEDQKFGFSITVRRRVEAVRRVSATPGLRLLGLHSHIGSQIFDTARLRGGRPAGAGAARRGAPTSSAWSCPSSTWAAASASPTPPRTTRPTPRSSPPS